MDTLRAYANAMGPSPLFTILPPISNKASSQHSGDQSHRHLKARGGSRELDIAGSVVARLALGPDVRDRDFDVLSLLSSRPHRLHR